MKKISHEELMGLEKYSAARDGFRQNIMAHKKNRVISVGPHMRFHFEDRLLMLYQVQEMLRAEKIFDAQGIQQELDAYNPLIPDGSNLKVTLMIEYSDPAERAEALKQLPGIENKVWIQVAGFDRVSPVADEDLERTTDEKTSSIHFLRFEFDADMVAAAKAGTNISLGVDHPFYQYSLEALAPHIAKSLVSDFN